MHKNENTKSRMLMLFAALLAIGITFSACVKEGKETIKTNNNYFEVSFLFEVDGCKVYRFWDGGATYYFTSCQGSISRKDKYRSFQVNTHVIPDTTNKMDK